MPPFITYQGRTGYMQNGQFIPATKEQYDQQMAVYNQFNGNPFINAQRQAFDPQQSVMQGTANTVLSNNDKVDIFTGTPMSNNNVPLSDVNSIPYGMQDGQLGFTQGKNFFPSTAMTAGGHPIIGNPATGQQANIFELKSPDRMADFMNPYAPLQSQMLAMGSAQSAGNNNVSNSNTINDTLGGGASSGWDEPEIPVEEVVDNVTPTDATKKPGLSADVKNQLIGTGIGMASKMVRNMAPDNYDERVGMTKPNAVGTVLGDATFTQIGFNPALMAATGGMSAVVGGGVDLLKNTFQYVKNKDKYENKKIGVNAMTAMEDQQANRKADFTGYARFGIEVNNPYLKYRNGGGPGDPKKKEQTEMTYSWGTGGYQAPTTQVQNTESSSVSKTIPVGYNLDKVSKQAISELDAIYSSPGYKEKLLWEDYNNKQIGFGDTNYYSKNLGPTKKYTNEDKNKTVDDIINERKYRLYNTPITAISNEESHAEGYYGYMQNDPKKNFLQFLYSGLENPFLNNPKIFMASTQPNEESFKSTLIEELEHASHIKKGSFPNYKVYQNNLNISPYAKYIFDNHAPASSLDAKTTGSHGYLNKYTENMAKKRAAEVYLINKGMIEPGGKVDDKHYDYLLKNYRNLPSNVKSALDMTNENDLMYDKEYIDDIKKTLEIYNKSNNKIEYYDIKNLKEKFKNYEKSKINFKKVMNEVAKSDKNIDKPTYA